MAFLRPGLRQAFARPDSRILCWCADRGKLALPNFGFHERGPLYSTVQGKHFGRRSMKAASASNAGFQPVNFAHTNIWCCPTPRYPRGEQETAGNRAYALNPKLDPKKLDPKLTASLHCGKHRDCSEVLAGDGE